MFYMNNMNNDFSKVKLLWIGCNLSDNQKQKLVSCGDYLMSGIVSQQSIIDGIDSYNVDMDSINSYHLISRKTMRKVYPQTWSRNGVSKDYSVGYINVKYISMVFRTIALKNAARKWAKLNQKKENVGILV